MSVSTFSPPRALRNPHLQTILPRLLRRRALLTPVWQRLTLPDGDFIDLAWSEAPQPARHKPRVVLFHGLEGSVHSPYAHGLLHACREAGWLAVVMHFRGCSGEPNLTPRFYHSGETGDARFFWRGCAAPSVRCPPRRSGSPGGICWAVIWPKSKPWPRWRPQ